LSSQGLVPGHGAEERVTDGRGGKKESTGFQKRRERFDQGKRSRPSEDHSGPRSKERSSSSPMGERIKKKTKIGMGGEVPCYSSKREVRENSMDARAVVIAF